jgi:hypothetical protein
MFAMNSRNGTLMAMVCICALCSHAEDRRFTVRDSIEMVTFSEPPRYVPGASPPVSPDGKHFAVVTSRGILESNKIETTIRLFDRTAVRYFLQQDSGTMAAPAPKVLARVAAVPVAFTGSPYSPLISDLRWASDSGSLYFLAQNAVGQHRLCNVDIRTGRVKALSPQTAYDVERYSIRDDLAVYVATRSNPVRARRSQLPGEKINDDASAVTGLSVASILFPNQGGQPIPQFRELWVSR